MVRRIAVRARSWRCWPRAITAEEAERLIDALEREQPELPPGAASRPNRRPSQVGRPGTARSRPCSPARGSPVPGQLDDLIETERPVRFGVNGQDAGDDAIVGGAPTTGGGVSIRSSASPNASPRRRPAPAPSWTSNAYRRGMTNTSVRRARVVNLGLVPGLPRLSNSSAAGPTCSGLGISTRPVCSFQFV
jgi:hypothetical protein